jgi:hypothetical protein
MKYYAAILRSEDYDPIYFMARHLFDRFGLDQEQRLWYCFLYAFTCNGPTSWAVFDRWPRVTAVDVEAFQTWESANYSRLVFDTDTRYNRGHLYEVVSAYVKTLGGRTQAEFFAGLCNSHDPRVNFKRMWKEVTSWYRFGRFAAFNYLEMLAECGGLELECDSLYLEEIGPSKSHRNGLILSLGMDHLDMHASNPVRVEHTPELIKYLTQQADSVLDTMRSTFPDIASKVTYFTAETAWCAYKGFFRRRRYLGFYLDHDCEMLKTAEEGWPELDWDPLWETRQKLHPQMLCENTRHFGVSREAQDAFMDQGVMVNLGLFFREGNQIGPLAHNKLSTLLDID